MYDIYSKNKSIEKEFDDLIASLDKPSQKKLMTSLARYPKGWPRTSRDELIGRIEKKGKFWQYYLADGHRLIYDVTDRPKEVIIQFMGDHNKAKIWLRENAR